MITHRPINGLITLKQIFKMWWPLSASWLLMGIEIPALSAVMARLPNAEINLAAYSGIVFPFSLVIEAPVIMLLSASTALSKDYASYQKLRRFTFVLGAFFTGIHILVAFTPLYDFAVRSLIGVPEELIEPARMGLRMMTPWTFSIAYRRFQQGTLIRFGHSEAVGTGTVIRLLAGGSVLLAGYLLGNIPGTLVGAGTQAFGVVCEAIYAGLRVRPVVRNEVRFAPAVEPLSLNTLLAFYVPLALNSLLVLVWQPIGSAAMSRMPMAIASLAAWQVLSGLVFMLRSFGFSFNEVVVALLGEPGTYAALRRFGRVLASATMVLHLLIVATPLAIFWFAGVSALPAPLAEMARVGFWIALPMAPMTAFQSWYQGAILTSGKTRAIPESVFIFLVTVLVLLAVGVIWGEVAGLYVGMFTFSVANLTQTLWLWYRSRPVLRQMRARDVEGLPAETA